MDTTSGDDHSGVQTFRLIDGARVLHERLHRVVVALAITEEMIADSLQRIADTGVLAAEDFVLNAKRARASAAECRAFAARLETLRPR